VHQISTQITNLAACGCHCGGVRINNINTTNQNQHDMFESSHSNLDDLVRHLLCNPPHGKHMRSESLFYSKYLVIHDHDHDDDGFQLLFFICVDQVSIMKKKEYAQVRGQTSLERSAYSIAHKKYLSEEINPLSGQILV
jgi:hypothetical protein